MKIPVLESLFNEVLGLETVTSSKTGSIKSAKFAKFCKVFKNIYFVEYLQTTASELVWY